MDNDNKIIVQRANVILTIAKDQLDYYKNQGYDVIDKNGNVLEASLPRDVGTLQKAFVDNAEEIQKLKETISELEAKLAEVKQPTKRSTKNKNPQE